MLVLALFSCPINQQYANWNSRDLQLFSCLVQNKMQRLTVFEKYQQSRRYHLSFWNSIINLSQNIFNSYEYKLLNKSRNFCRPINRYNKKQLTNGTDAFARKIKLNAHFKNKVKDTENREFRISRNKTWTQTENHYTAETFTHFQQTY